VSHFFSLLNEKVTPNLIYFICVVCISMAFDVCTSNIDGEFEISKVDDGWPRDYLKCVDQFDLTILIDMS